MHRQKKERYTHNVDEGDIASGSETKIQAIFDGTCLSSNIQKSIRKNFLSALFCFPSAEIFFAMVGICLTFNFVNVFHNTWLSIFVLTAKNVVS